MPEFEPEKVTTVTIDCPNCSRRNRLEDTIPMVSLGRVGVSCSHCGSFIQTEDELWTNQFSNQDKMRCAQREASYRRWVYEKRVADDKMTRQEADHEIALMEEIALEYGAAAKAERERLEPMMI